MSASPIVVMKTVFFRITLFWFKMSDHFTMQAPDRQPSSGALLIFSMADNRKTDKQAEKAKTKDVLRKLLVMQR